MLKLYRYIVVDSLKMYNFIGKKLINLVIKYNLSKKKIKIKISEMLHIYHTDL